MSYASAYLQKTFTISELRTVANNSGIELKGRLTKSRIAEIIENSSDLASFEIRKMLEKKKISEITHILGSGRLANLKKIYDSSLFFDDDEFYAIGTPECKEKFDYLLKKRRASLHPANAPCSNPLSDAIELFMYYLLENVELADRMVELGVVKKNDIRTAIERFGKHNKTTEAYTKYNVPEYWTDDMFLKVLNEKSALCDLAVRYIYENGKKEDFEGGEMPIHVGQFVMTGILFRKCDFCGKKLSKSIHYGKKVDLCVDSHR